MKRVYRHAEQKELFFDREIEERIEGKFQFRIEKRRYFNQEISALFLYQ